MPFDLTGARVDLNSGSQCRFVLSTLCFADIFIEIGSSVCGIGDGSCEVPPAFAQAYCSDLRLKDFSATGLFGPTTGILMRAKTAQRSSHGAGLDCVREIKVHVHTFDAPHFVNISHIKVGRVDNGRAVVVARAGVIARGSVTSPVPIIKTVFVPVPVTSAVTVVVWVPAYIVRAVDPGDSAGFISRGGERDPDPAIRHVVSPHAVMVGVPSPGVVGDPVPAGGLVPAPITVLVRLPFVLVAVGRPEPVAVDVNPTSHSSE